MHNRYIHYVLDKQLGKVVNCADWNISSSWLCVQLGEQAGERSCPSKPLPAQAIPVLLPGSVASKHLAVILAVVLRRGRVWSLTKKPPLCGTWEHPCGYQLPQLAPQEARRCKKQHFSVDFLFCTYPAIPLILKKHQHPSPHYRDESFT